jgi:hypothetical protein
MAAGQGFKTFTTGEVLTAADVNGYLMQGVNVFANATERDAEITSPQEGQFAYLKDTNVTTYYTGSAWANLDTTGMTNPMTTTGDTIYSSSGSTPARLGIGSTGQVLTVSGGVPTWATAAGGAFTQLATGTLSGTTLTISSINQTYQHLYLIVNSAQVGTGNANPLVFRANSNSDSIYSSKGGTVSASTWSVFNGESYWSPTLNNQNILTTANSFHNSLFIENYATTTMKNISSVHRGDSNTGAGAWNTFHSFNSTTAITSLSITTAAGDRTFTAGTYTLYGVK